MLEEWKEDYSLRTPVEARLLGAQDLSPNVRSFEAEYGKHRATTSCACTPEQHHWVRPGE